MLLVVLLIIQPNLLLLALRLTSEGTNAVPVNECQIDLE
jgi:hypothetical protein